MSENPGGAITITYTLQDSHHKEPLTKVVHVPDKDLQNPHRHFVVEMEAAQAARELFRAAMARRSRG